MSEPGDRELERAERLFAIGQIDGAIDALKRALTEDPDHPDAHAWLAICLLRKRRLYAARVEADMAMALAPESLLSHWVAAELSMAAREFDRAGRHVERLLSDAPGSADFYRLKARLMSLTGQDKQRLPVLEQALSCDPEDPETLAALADFHRTAGHAGEAERYAGEALEISAENTSALVVMGYVLLDRGDVEGAREHALSVLQADPEDTSALRLLTAVKARSNPALGLWWRYATWAMRVGPTRNIIVLLIAYVVYRALTIWATDAGSTGFASAVTVGWLAIVVYSFAGPTLFNRALRKELEAVRLKPF